MGNQIKVGSNDVFAAFRRPKLQQNPVVLENKPDKVNFSTKTDNKKNNIIKYSLIAFGAALFLGVVYKRKRIGELVEEFVVNRFRRPPEPPSENSAVKTVEESLLNTPSPNKTPDIEPSNIDIPELNPEEIAHSTQINPDEAAKIPCENINQGVDEDKALSELGGAEEISPAQEPTTSSQAKTEIKTTILKHFKPQSEAYLFDNKEIDPDKYGTFFEQNISKDPILTRTVAGDFKVVNSPIPEYLYHITSGKCAANIMKEGKLNKANIGAIDGVYTFDFNNLRLHEKKINNALKDSDPISYGKSILSWYSNLELNPLADGKIALLKIPTKCLEDRIVTKPINLDATPQKVMNVFVHDFETDLFEFIIKEDKHLDLNSNGIKVIGALDCKVLAKSETPISDFISKME